MASSSVIQPSPNSTYPPQNSVETVMVTSFPQHQQAHQQEAPTQQQQHQLQPQPQPEPQTQPEPQAQPEPQMQPQLQPQPKAQNQRQLRVVVQNVTATVSTRLTLDLVGIASKTKNAEYNPKKLPACVMRIREPQATGLIFQSGKLVITGAQGIEEAKEAGLKLVKVLEALLLKPSFANFTVQNIVATVEMDYAINLELMAYFHARWCMYEPELFPGLVYQRPRRGVVAHVFSSGRVVLTGAKQEEHLNDALVNLIPIIEQVKEID